MSQPYVGEIRMFAGNFAPAGWMFCDGQELPIAENEVLFQLIGTTYGGDGETVFALPNLQSRVPLHVGQFVNNYLLGETGGVESVTLTTNQIPIHAHAPVVSSAVASQTNPLNNLLAQSTQAKLYFDSNPGASLAASVISPAGGSQPHENCQPFLCVNFIISLFGVFPSPT